MHKVGHTEQNPGKLQCLGLQVSTRATLQAILYPKNFLYLFDRLTDEDMAVMDSLVRKIWKRAKDIGIIIVFNFLRTWVGFARRNTEIVFEN